MYDVTGVKHLGAYVLRITFENGEQAQVDLKGYAELGGIFSPLSDINYFKQAAVNPDVGTICWPNGADIAPETLYRLAKPKAAS